MWIDPSTLHTYTTHAEIRAAFRQISFPSGLTGDAIAAAGLVPVVPTERPSYDASTQKVEAAPALDGDTWRQQWTVVTLSESERRALIPSVVSRKQARMALVLSGIPLASVQAAIDAIEDDTQRALAQIAWEDATEFRRDDPFLAMLSGALGLTEAQLDDLFSLAATL